MFIRPFINEYHLRCWFLSEGLVPNSTCWLLVRHVGSFLSMLFRVSMLFCGYPCWLLVPGSWCWFIVDLQSGASVSYRLEATLATKKNKKKQKEILNLEMLQKTTKLGRGNFMIAVGQKQEEGWVYRRIGLWGYDRGRHWWNMGGLWWVILLECWCRNVTEIII